MRCLTSALSTVCLLAAAGPAAAFDTGRTPLALGLDPALAASSLPSARIVSEGGVRLDLGVAGPLAAGPAIEPVPDGFHLIPGGHGRKALGGFLEADLSGVRVTSLVSGARDGGRAEVSAAYAFGDTRVIMRLGGEWADSTAFGESSYQDGVDVSLTLRHDLTPSLYVAGTAAANTAPESSTEGSGLLFGASIGLRF